MTLNIKILQVLTFHILKNGQITLNTKLHPDPLPVFNNPLTL